jgi:phosphoribosylanthranilate isomerase
VPVDVKFCGLTQGADARAAAEAGAAYLGVIFAGGPRLVTVDAAARVLAAGGGRARRVGVFAAEEPDAVAATATSVPLDVVQLHGDPDARQVERLRTRWHGAIWAVLRCDGPALPPGAARLFRAADAVVLDAKVANRLGGTGVAVDWPALRAPVERLRGETPVVLAGGLTPDNVSTAIGALSPDVVDVSSGVERSPGIKDHARMRAFADAVRLYGAAR